MAEAIRGTVFGAAISGAAVPQSGVTVTIYKAGTTNLASLYSDDALLASISNPIVSETDGSYFAFAPNGKYDVVFSKTGVTFDSTDSIGEVLWDEQIVKTVTATSYTLVDNDYIILADATGAAQTINLPALSVVQAGRPWIIIKIDATANAVTLDPSGAETINGAATLILSASKQGVTIRKGSTEWQTDLPPAQTTSGAGKIPLGRSSDGKLEMSWIQQGSGSTLDADLVDNKNPGSASGIATLDINTRVVEPANTIYDTIGNRSASPNYSANVVPIRDAEGSLLFKPATLMVVPLGLSFDWATVTVVGTGTQSLRGMFLRHATSAATNDLVATWNTSTPFMPTDFFSSPYPINIEWTVITPDVTTSSYHCRLSAVNTDPSAADTHDHVGFKLIDGTWYGTNGNGTTGNSTSLVADPGVGIRRLQVAITNTAIRYYVNGVLRATHTTNLPNYTATGNYMIVQTKTTTTAIRIAHWQRFLYEKGM